MSICDNGTSELTVTQKANGLKHLYPPTYISVIKSQKNRYLRIIKKNHTESESVAETIITFSKGLK